MKQKLLSAFLAAAMFCTAAIPAVSASEKRNVQNIETVTDAPLAQAALDETSVYNAMIALQDEYPDGMEWTNDNFYMWNGGGPYSGGYGCVAFAFILSDAAFGDLPARQVNTLDLSVIRVGDIIRYSGHSVIVLEVYEDYVVVAEGNINSSVMWGREVTLDEMLGGFEHYLTRYPADEEETTEPTTEEPSDARFYVRLEISSEPDRTDYFVGEELDLTGLTINTWYTEFGTWLTWKEDASVTDCPNTEDEYIKVTGYDPYTLGSQEISVTLHKYNDVLDEWVLSTDYFHVIVYEEGTSPNAGLGDVDVNGIVDATDAADLLVAAAAIGAGNDSRLDAAQTANADVDGNGVLDATDAAWILRYAAYIGTGGDSTMEEFFAQNA